ncbi:MAG TPA: DNA-binding protein [Pedococcus sp.]|nr:DNA-binding protein [Pedococcus sp.]
MTALPRLAAPAARALAADGLTTLEDVVAAGRAHVASLHGMGPRALALLDEAVAAAGLCEAESPR